MRHHSLTGVWEFRQAGTQEWLPASVPGGVHTDLLTLGHIPDPFVADNEQRLQWVAEADWIYRVRFSCSPELLAEEKIVLVCEGLDTLASVVLNGHELGHTDNMFRRYEWEVKLLDSQGTNELTITFDHQCDMWLKASHSSSPGVSQAILAVHTCARRLSIWLGLGPSSHRSASGRISVWRVTVRRC
jgi:beta-mannosidase